MMSQHQQNFLWLLTFELHCYCVVCTSEDRPVGAIVAGLRGLADLGNDAHAHGRMSLATIAAISMFVYFVHR